MQNVKKYEYFQEICINNFVIFHDIDCQIDVYVYQFFVTDIFDEVHVYRGRVTLVR